MGSWDFTRRFVLSSVLLNKKVKGKGWLADAVSPSTFDPNEAIFCTCLQDHSTTVFGFVVVLRPSSCSCRQKSLSERFVHSEGTKDRIPGFAFRNGTNCATSVYDGRVPGIESQVIYSVTLPGSHTLQYDSTEK